MSMSPEKEKELANKILERAQIAQMTRQLKLGLSKVPTSKLNSNRASDDTNDGDTQNLHKKRVGEPLDTKLSPIETSPLKKQLLNNNFKKITSPLKQKYDNSKPSTPPRIFYVTSDNNSSQKQDKQNESDTEHTPVKVPSTPGRSSNQNSANKFLMTPKRRLSSSNPNNKTANNPNENNAGADLLMYLATSPYTSNKSAGNSNGSSNHMFTNKTHSNSLKIPTTPSSSAYMNQQHNNDDAICYSNMKATFTSPQSTFKVPQLVSNNGTSTLSFQDVLIESPSIYLKSNPFQTNALSPQKRKQQRNNNNNQQTLLPTIPTTPSRDMSNSTGTDNSSTTPNHDNSNINSHNNANSNLATLNLLKTPNFNMGDYIHNLFSPSPQVPASNPNNLNVNMSKGGISGFNGLLAASAASMTNYIPKQQPIPTSSSNKPPTDDIGSS